MLVDGYDLAHVRLDSYRTQLGVVLQDTFLFDGTIARTSRLRVRCHRGMIFGSRIARVDNSRKD